MSNTSYIRLNRKILDWEWYGDINTCRLFIHMLLKANWKDGEFKGKHIPRGSFVSSFGKLAEETQLTVDEVRTAVKHLISTKEITKQAYSKFTVFTVKNYDAYQFVPSNFPNKSQATDSQRSQYSCGFQDFAFFNFPSKSHALSQTVPKQTLRADINYI